MVEKVLCIKDFNINLIKDKVYDVYISLKGLYNMYDVGSEKCLVILHEYDFVKYFITLAEWRDKQINEILNG